MATTIPAPSARWQAFPHGRVPWAAIGAGWTAVLVLDQARRFMIDLLVEGRTGPWFWILVAVLWQAAFWSAATPPALELGMRFPLARGRRTACVLLHLAAGSAAALLGVAWLVALYRGVGGYPFTARETLLREFHPGLACYLLLAALAQLLAHARRAHDREVRAAVLQGRLTEARTEALKRQMEPHFLYNTLNSIAALVHPAPAAAGRMIASLASLIRGSTVQGGASEVPLEQELRLVRAYLDIQQTRFAGRLAAEIVVEPGAERACVPPLLLQTLVENAIRHGLSSRAGPGRVEVRARVRGAELELRVRDDGAGLPAAGVVEGVGLGNTRARLRALYGPAHRLELLPATGGGAAAHVALPFRPCAPAPAGEREINRDASRDGGGR